MDSQNHEGLTPRALDVRDALEIPTYDFIPPKKNHFRYVI